MLLWTSSALECRVILPVSSESQFSPVLRLSGILTLFAFLHLPQDLDYCCMPTLGHAVYSEKKCPVWPKEPRIDSDPNPRV